MSGFGCRKRPISPEDIELLSSPRDAAARVKGIFNIAITPFGDDGKIDFDAHAENLDRVIDLGYDGVLVGGQYGEFATMTVEERLELSTRTMEIVDKRVPVMLGAGGSEPATVRKLVETNGGLGGLPMVTVPYVSEVKDSHIFAYFEQIAPLSGTGILIYNMPETGHIISPQLLERLADIDGIVGVKQGDLTPAVVDRIAGRLLGKFRVMGASDLHFLGPLMTGFHGSTSTNSSALPELILKTFRALESGDAKTATRLHMKWYPLRQLMREIGQPQTTKAIMTLRGWRGGHARLPLPDLTADQVSRVRDALKALEVDEESEVAVAA